MTPFLKRPKRASAGLLLDYLAYLSQSTIWLIIGVDAFAARSRVLLLNSRMRIFIVSGRLVYDYERVEALLF